MPREHQRNQSMAPRNQLTVLHALDIARTQVYHFTAIAIAGMGFFTDAYDLFSISLVSDLLGHIYYGSDGLPVHVAAAVSGVALCGAVPGQLFFGWLGDKVGRKRVYGVTLKLMVACSLASGLSFSKRTGKSVITVLCFFRFWLGFSIGGDYPLSATIMSEYANKRTRGAFIAAVFAMQGFGNLAAGIVGIIVSAAFTKSPAKVDYVWRIILMFGAIPAILTYYWRMKMPETARYTALVAKNATKAASDMSEVLNMDITPEHAAVDAIARSDEFGLFSTEFLRRHGLHLLGTTVCWFVLDVAFFSLNLFMKDIFTQVGLLPRIDKNSSLRRMYKITGVYTLVALFGTLPGYFVTVMLVDRLGRVRIQLLGFAMMTFFILVLAVPYENWVDPRHKFGFAVVYGLTFFFANFGPNSTAFILPAEIFPTRLRSTCHGISGAGGKLGAVVGVFSFLYTQQHVRNSLLVFVPCNLVGIAFTFVLPESKGKSLEELTGEIEDEEAAEDGDAVAGEEYIHAVPL